MTYFDELFFLPSGIAQEGDGANEVFSLHFCRAGQVWWKRADDEPRALPAPLAWWTVPGERVTIVPSDEICEHFEVTFCGPRARWMQSGGLIESDLAKPHFVLFHDANEFERLFLTLLTAIENGDVQHSAPPRAVILLEQLLLMLGEHRAPAPSLSPLEQAVSEWLERVKAAPEREWDSAQVAREFSVSQGHFRRVVRKLAGVSPYRFTLERRLDAAALRLRGSKEPIKTLAPACGFNDLNQFTRLFAARYHLPPAAYRRANRVVSLETARLRRRQKLPV